jgi:hypothetical protein
MTDDWADMCAAAIRAMAQEEVVTEASRKMQEAKS